MYFFQLRKIILGVFSMILSKIDLKYQLRWNFECLCILCSSGGLGAIIHMIIFLVPRENDSDGKQCGSEDLAV